MEKREIGYRRRPSSGIRRAQDETHQTAQENSSPRSYASHNHSSVPRYTVGRARRMPQNLLPCRNEILVARNDRPSEISSEGLWTLQSGKHDVAQGTENTASDIIRRTVRRCHNGRMGTREDRPNEQKWNSCATTTGKANPKHCISYVCRRNDRTCHFGVPKGGILGSSVDHSIHSMLHSTRDAQISID